MLSVRDYMTRDVVTVPADASLRDVALLLVEHRISGLPVVEDGRVVGVVSESDLLTKAHGADGVEGRPFGRLLGESRATQDQVAKIEATSARDAMTSPPLTIGPERPVVEAAASMNRNGVNRLPVVDDGRLVGIISRGDLARAFTRSDDELADVVRDALLYQTLWLDPATFDVAVERGTVRIRGKVERRSTAGMIERIPTLIPGVIAVDADVAWEIDDHPAPGG
jgi:CBS domain-containing protein